MHRRWFRRDLLVGQIFLAIILVGAFFFADADI
jgi:hypothetical protein